MGFKAEDHIAHTLAGRLGYARDARLLIIHADDLGMCHAVNAASTAALLDGCVSSGSVMVPCPWFPSIAAWAREHPDADLGVHLTLTSEWRYYRWAPVAPPDRVRGLIDPEGYLWRSVAEVREHASPEEVEIELRAQIERARQFGMRPTHIDSHMGTLFADPRFFEVYVRIARETGIVPMLMEATPEILAQAGQWGIDYAPLAAGLKAAGYPLLDRLVADLGGDSLEARRHRFHTLLRDLRPGVTELIVHLAADTEEIRQICGSWRARCDEFRLFTDPATRAEIRDQDVTLIGYRALAAPGVAAGAASATARVSG